MIIYRVYRINCPGILAALDRAIAEVLVEVNKQKGFSLYLGNVTLHQICSGCGYSYYQECTMRAAVRKVGVRIANAFN